MGTRKQTIGTIVLGTAISLAFLFGMVWVAGKAWKTATS